MCIISQVQAVVKKYDILFIADEVTAYLIHHKVTDLTFVVSNMRLPRLKYFGFVFHLQLFSSPSLFTCCLVQISINIFQK
jgi:hypothetical protein